MVYFWVRKVTFHSVCMYVHVILLHCFPSLVFILNLNKLWTNTSSRHYTDEKKKERLLFEFARFVFTKVLIEDNTFTSPTVRDWHFTWSSELCEDLAICRAKAVQYPHFSVIRCWVLVWPLGMKLWPLFMALNALEPLEFVKGSKYSLWWSFIMILKTFFLD